MSVGIVMLVHTALGRAEQVARHWSAAGCPVVLHVDHSVTGPAHRAFVSALSDLQNVAFSKRFRCEWGTWGIVAASQAGAEQLLAQHPGITHVFLASGSCLPLRPVQELVQYLESHQDTDFIESATTADVRWTVGGLEQERFTLRFLFSWKRQRFLFDKTVAFQRRFGLRRRIPPGIVPHIGSQWWCLSRRTLSAILHDPQRPRYERYFRQVWIPDESYFQTLARRHSAKIESRSLTLCKFDFQGKPHIFYDDHLHLLRRSDCFVARKIWPFANRLYDVFLTDEGTGTARTEPNPGKIERVFAKAVERRTRGRPGLYMQSRFPHEGWENGVTVSPYSVFQGFAELFDNFDAWLAKATGAQVHGHLFARDRVHFANAQTMLNGALSNSAKLRDYNAEAFLTNLIWNTRGKRQCFHFGPADQQDINRRLAKDPNAQVSVITGAWAVPLFRSNLDFAEIRARAARLQRIESEQVDVLRSSCSKARVRIWTMAEFIEAPMEPLQGILDEIGRIVPRRLAEAPRMVDLTGFDQFLQSLKNQGMHTYLTGEFPVDHGLLDPPEAARKPYLVR